jgi:hypothetical protein
MKNKLSTFIAVVAFVAMVGVLAAGKSFAQTPTPGSSTTTPNTQTQPLGKGTGLDRELGMWGGSFTQFDAAAKVLNLTPTQLFEQLHSGKTLQEIATAQSVDIQKVQDAINANRVQAQKDAIALAVKNGQITQAQADWMLQGLANGYMPAGRGGPGGHGHRGGGLGLGNNGNGTTTPATPVPGSST